MKTKSIFVLAILITFPVLNDETYAETEIWSGAIGRDPGIRRFATDGTSLGSISLNTSVKSMALVGDEIWYGADDMPGFSRLTLNGTPLPSISGNWSPTSIVVVGDEVWYGSKYLLGINRCTFDGTPLPSISTHPWESSTLCVVSGDEIWSGAIGRDPGIRRFATDGTSLGTISFNTSVKSMALVGDEVWYGADDMPGFSRLTLNGTPLPSISGNWSPTSIVVVGDEVWYGSKYLLGINRCTFDGTPLPSISTHPWESSSLVITPEPATLLLLGLGAIALRRKRS
jgi:hypothetical protein